MYEPTSQRPAPSAQPAAVALVTDDFSADHQALRRRLMAETGGGYQRFVNQLSARYRRAWTDIALGYLYLGLVLYLVGLAASVPAAAGLGALAVGYGVAYLQLFLHEAAHYNLAADRRLNDLLCDALISWQVGTTVGHYRPIHFAHHRHLGTRADTENSYFRPLGPRLVLETLTGVHALRIALNRRRRLDARAGTGRGAPARSGPILGGVLLHAVVSLIAYAYSGWPAVAAWILGVGAFYPLFATLRQLLEHRSTQADASVDYTLQDHGAVTRMFGVGPLASTFGGAGFNRHLLHHWEPQVSYTRLADLERYLAGTSAAQIMAARRSSYLGAFKALWAGTATARAT